MPTSIAPPFEIFERLKTATATAHLQVEAHVPVFDPEFDLIGYIQLPKRFYGFWAPTEAKLLHIDSLQHPALALETRMKSHLLEVDLRTLGQVTSAVPYCLCLPLIETLPAALGCLYVLEGSTLGARFISKRLESHLGLHTGSGASFFNAYGETTGRRWSEFRSFVTAHVPLEQSGEAVSAATQTFESLRAWLETSNL